MGAESDGTLISDFVVVYGVCSICSVHTSQITNWYIFMSRFFE